MITLLVAHFAAALLLPRVARSTGPRVFLIAAIVPALTTVWAVWHAPGILAGTPVLETFQWAPALGFDIQLRVDAFALLMIALVSGIGTLIFCYSAYYFSDNPGIGRLAMLLLAFAGAMLGLVLADNLLALYLFWELTSVTSYLLIGFEDRTAAARAAALRALLITAAGGLAMLGGFVLLGHTAGTYVLSEILALRPSDPASQVALLLILFGAFTKSAQVPFHFWLPGAMAAPTPVSAYLHSATMVKAGVYLIARLAPAFAEVPFWRPLVIGVGLSTMIVGGWRAMSQRDAKLLLAHGTTSQLGLLVVLFGAGYEKATLAGATVLLAHGAFKAALFMVVGIVDHKAGTRDITRLSGMHRPLRTTFLVAVAAVASMAGLPPMLGFVAKEGAFEALAGALGAPWRALILTLMVTGSALTFAYSVRFLWGVFADKKPGELGPEEAVTTAKRPAWPFVAPAALLAIVTLVFGVLPGAISEIVVAGARALDIRTPPYRLALWHGFNEALALSAAAITLGLLLWRMRLRVSSLQTRYRFPVAGARIHDAAVGYMVYFADWLTGRMQSGSLPMYLMIILGTAVAVPGALLLSGIAIPRGITPVDRPMQLAVALIMAAATLVAVRSARRMVAVVAVGFVGYGVAFLFVIHGAPDLALTQLLIETLLLVLFVLVLRHLPPTFSARGDDIWKLPRTVVAVSVGLFTATLALVAAGARLDASLANEFLTRALPEGDGRNVVNVILVDFRAFDTFGEIVVLTVAALGVLGLVRAAQRDRERDLGAEHSPALQYRSSPILDGAVQALFHTVLMFSLVLLVVGHDRPGGGFIGGLVGGAAFILVYLAGGDVRVRRAEPLYPEALLGAGLTLAAGTGAAAWFVGREFLEAMTLYRDLPLIGTIKLSSVFLFDVGVYLVVIGLVIALLRSLGREEVRVS
ncbi:Na+/H+ antiporter subunit A [soil metagenome]